MYHNTFKNSCWLKTGEGPLGQNKLANSERLPSKVLMDFLKKTSSSTLDGYLWKFTKNWEMTELNINILSIFQDRMNCYHGNYGSVNVT